jgi:hypothetical protein
MDAKHGRAAVLTGKFGLIPSGTRYSSELIVDTPLLLKQYLADRRLRIVEFQVHRSISLGG